jgi:hypothetical protein
LEGHVERMGRLLMHTDRLLRRRWESNIKIGRLRWSSYSVLTVGPKIRGFKPFRGQCFLRQ